MRSLALISDIARPSSGKLNLVAPAVPHGTGPAQSLAGLASIFPPLLNHFCILVCEESDVPVPAQIAPSVRHDALPIQEVSELGCADAELVGYRLESYNIH